MKDSVNIWMLENNIQTLQSLDHTHSLEESPDPQAKREEEGVVCGQISSSGLSGLLPTAGRAGGSDAFHNRKCLRKTDRNKHAQLECLFLTICGTSRLTLFYGDLGASISGQLPFCQEVIT